MNYNTELFKENLNNIGLEVTQDVISKLDAFAEMLIEKNKVMNLTAILDPDGIAVKHFADSLSLLKAIEIKDNAKILDLGTGAGFPGIPLLIAKPGLEMTLIDSTAKKLTFVSESIDNLGLNAEVLHTRAEEAGKNPQYREKYDIVCSRAVAALNVLCEYCLPFVKVGGTFAAMKGAQAEEEIRLAENAIKTLGGTIKDKFSFRLSDGERTIVIIEKVKPTPVKYPRVSAQIAKKAL